MNVNEKNERLLPPEKVRELFDYDPATGALTWRCSPNKGIDSGSEAGAEHGKGYRRVTVAEKRYLVHRVIWAFVTGRWPARRIDHRDGKRSHNAWHNLRQATNAENAQNTKRARVSASGHVGVYWRENLKRYVVSIDAYRTRHHLGVFESLDEAVAARAAAKARLHPFQPFDRA